MSDVIPPDQPADLPAPTPPPPVTDSPLGMLADATPAPTARPKPVAKKVVKKVVKKVAKKAAVASGSGASTGAARPPQARPAQAKGTAGPPRARAAAASAAKPRAGAGAGPRPRTGDPLDALLDDRKAPVTDRSVVARAGGSIKGMVIIAIALGLGFVLLSAGYQRDGTLIAGKSQETVESTTTTGSPFSTTTSVTFTVATTGPLKKPAELTVQVANGGKIPGTPAGDNTRKLSAAGYKTKSAVDDNKGVAATVVYYRENLKAEAEAVAGVLGFEPSVVAELPDPAPTFAQGADIVVELGPDYKPS